MTEIINIPLSIAFDTSPAIEREEGDWEKSIDAILDLIVFTPKGTFNADPEFGFEYWNHEFSNINIREFNNSYIGLIESAKSLNDISRKQCEDSLRESILEYEPRLSRPDVKIELGVSNYSRKGSKQSKYEMRILITGAIDEGLGITRQYEKKFFFMVEPVAHRISI